MDTCEGTLDCSAAVSKRCSAISYIGKPTKRQYTGYPVKGTDLCARHAKQAMAKLLTSKRKRETDHIEDNEQCLPQPFCPPAKRLSIETPGGKKVVTSSAPM